MSKKPEPLKFNELTPGRLYGMSGGFDVYAYSSPVPGELVPVAVYKPLTPFLLLGICKEWHSNEIFACFAKVLFGETLCYLAVGFIRGLTGEQHPTFHEFGPRNEGQIGEKTFYEFLFDEA